MVCILLSFSIWEKSLQHPLNICHVSNVYSLRELKGLSCDLSIIHPLFFSKLLDSWFRARPVGTSRNRPLPSFTWDREDISVSSNFGCQVRHFIYGSQNGYLLDVANTKLCHHGTVRSFRNGGENNKCQYLLNFP